MSDPNQPSTPPGWYPDGQGGQRWWDGSQWTEHTQPGSGQGGPAAPQAPQAPSVPGHDAPTQIAPNRASAYPPQQQPYGAPQQPAQQQPYGAPAQQPYGAPQYGGPQYGATSAGSSGSGSKKGLLIGIVVAVVLLLVVCGVGGFFLLKGGDDPKSVAEDYLNALADQDNEKACELETKDLQQQSFEGLDVSDCGEYADKIDELSAAAEADPMEGLDDVSFDLEDADENGDKATVDYTVHYKEDGEAQTEDGTVSLVKEDGDWRVDEFS